MSMIGLIAFCKAVHRHIGIMLAVFRGYLQTEVDNICGRGTIDESFFSSACVIAGLEKGQISFGRSGAIVAKFDAYRAGTFRNIHGIEAGDATTSTSYGANYSGVI
jgi:hypothetical protein